jgi:hypothetical protein
MSITIPGAAYTYVYCNIIDHGIKLLKIRKPVK